MINKNSLTLVITILTSLLLGYTFTFAQTTYYVSTSGNNNNNGTDQSTPWKTLSHINSSIFNYGDIIKFKRGDAWEGDIYLGLNASNHTGLKITDYGNQNLAKPIMKNMIDSQLTWVNTGFTNNGYFIWKATTNGYIVRLFNNNEEILQSSRQIDLGTYSLGLYGYQTLQKWYFRYNESSENEVYIITSPENNPNDFDLKYAPRYYTIDLHNVNKITIENIDVRGSYGPSIWVRDSDTIKIQNCTIGKYSETGIKFQGNCTKPTIQNNLIDSAWSSLGYGDNEDTNPSIQKLSSKRGVGDGINFVGGVTNGWIQGNTIYDWGHTGIEFLAESTSLNGVNNNHVSNNYISAKQLSYGRGIAIDGVLNKCRGNVFRYNYITNCKAQIQFNGNNNRFHHNIVKKTENTPCKPNTPNGGGRGLELSIYGQNLVCQSNRIDNNLFYENESWGVSINNYYNNSFNREVFNIYIRNNTRCAFRKSCTNC